MTYSVELFICMVMGLVVGHAIFNTGQDLYCFIVFTIFHIQRLQWEKVWTLAVLLRQLLMQMMPNTKKLKTRNFQSFVFTIPLSISKSFLIDSHFCIFHRNTKVKSEGSCCKEKKSILTKSNSCSREICYENTNFGPKGSFGIQVVRWGPLY